MSALRPVRGTRDVLREESARQRWIEESAFAIAVGYGFGEVSTPIFEFTEVFARTLGETSDIVTKEMYTLEDRGGEKLTLRPENTAGIVRAFIGNGLAQQLPFKAFYRGPMFRYERPQKGRLRQFHQIGVELLGVASPVADIEVLALACDVLGALGLVGQFSLEINTLGDASDRARYRDHLVRYLGARKGELSADSVLRLDRNPLRILDSKDAGDRAVLAEAPLIGDHLGEHSARFFQRVLAGLDHLRIPYVLNPKLVRGLDYYCHTTFEFTTDRLGAQGTLLAGGRYDGLVEQMGGPPTPGIGWAAGVERLMMLVPDVPTPPRPWVVLPFSDAETPDALSVARRLRRAGAVVELGLAGGFGKQLKWANRIGARFAVMLGPDELARHAATVRDLDTGEQTEVPLVDLDAHLAHHRSR